MSARDEQGIDISETPLYRKVYGCLVGGMIGDAMGAPTEGKTYGQIAEQFGEVTDFEGVGTDDTAIRNQLCDALIEHGGYVTCDEFATTFIKFKRQHYKLWWVPVHNLFHKLEAGLTLPVDTGYGNMQSSSSSMAISPMGIINAGDPRRAAVETFDVAGLVHSGPTGYCRDAACGMAAAVAEAFKPTATVASVIDAATRYLHPQSAASLIGLTRTVLGLARESGGYEAFRASFYERHLYPTISDSRETFPATLAIFLLANGDTERAIVQAANFGRDADTIATMVGGLVGALNGVESLRPSWVARVEANPEADYRQTARRLTELIVARAGAERSRLDQIDHLLNR